jgi:hypothetical protein
MRIIWTAYITLLLIECLFRRLLKGLQYVARVIVTDKLRSYSADQRQLIPTVEQRQSQYLNNRAANSHRPPRRHNRQMQRFKSPEQARCFLSAHSFIYGKIRNPVLPCGWTPTLIVGTEMRRSMSGIRRRGCETRHDAYRGIVLDCSPPRRKST